MSLKISALIAIVSVGVIAPLYSADDDLALPIRKGGSADKKKTTAEPKAVPEKASTKRDASTPKTSGSARSASSGDEGDSASRKISSKSTAATQARETASKKKADAPAEKSAASKEDPENLAEADAVLLDSIHAKRQKSTSEAPDESQSLTAEKPSAKTATTDDADSDAAPVAAGSEESAPAPGPEPAATTAPNFYVANPAPPRPPAERRNILQRMLGLGRSAPATPPSRTQSAFNSDYATRGNNSVLPAVLDGLGYGGVDLPIGSEDQYRLATLPSTFRPTDLVRIPQPMCYYGNAIYLRSEAANSLCQMFTAAAAEGLNIKIFSGYRDYTHQMRLYSQAVAKGGENQKMVARPGKSEHQLGTTADVTNGNAHLMKRSFLETREGRWLAANAGRYGWKMTVMAGEGRRSHSDEPWHIRYLGSAVNGTPANYVAQPNSQPQRRSVLGSVGRLLGFGRR